MAGYKKSPYKGMNEGAAETDRDPINKFVSDAADEAEKKRKELAEKMSKWFSTTPTPKP